MTARDKAMCRLTTTDRYINPYTDFGFKKLFGSEVNKELLIDFLNELIKEKGKITDVRYLQSEQLGALALDRKAIFDIYCETDSGEKFIVEMQKAKQNYFKDRSLFYATFPIRDQAQLGAWDFELKAVYLVGILDFVFTEEQLRDDSYHHEIKLMDTVTKTVFNDKLTFIYLEMPKFNKTEQELASHFDKWLYVLKHLPDLTKRPARLQERVFEKLFKAAEIAKFTATELDAYENSLKVYRDMKNVIDTAWDEGEQKGMEKGIAKGRKEGRREGIAEGERQKALVIARNALKQNLPSATISAITGLAEEEINKLK
jgi:predicted transposase/invertase (TIGR01784 family)